MTFVNQDPILITSNSLRRRIVWLQSSVMLAVKANFKFLYFFKTSSQRNLTDIRLKLQYGRKTEKKVRTDIFSIYILCPHLIEVLGRQRSVSWSSFDLEPAIHSL